MTDAISSHNRVRTTTPNIDNKGASSQATPSQSSNSQSSSSVVDIKSTKLLEALSAKIDKIPDMDMAKVDSIKQSIANGDFQPNADVIAQKFIAIERLL